MAARKQTSEWENALINVNDHLEELSLVTKKFVAELFDGEGYVFDPDALTESALPAFQKTLNSISITDDWHRAKARNALDDDTAIEDEQTMFWDHYPALKDFVGIIGPFVKGDVLNGDSFNGSRIAELNVKYADMMRDIVIGSQCEVVKLTCSHLHITICDNSGIAIALHPNTAYPPALKSSPAKIVLDSPVELVDLRRAADSPRYMWTGNINAHGFVTRERIYLYPPYATPTPSSKIEPTDADEISLGSRPLFK